MYAILSPKFSMHTDLYFTRSTSTVLESRDSVVHIERKCFSMSAVGILEGSVFCSLSHSAVLQTDFATASAVGLSGLRWTGPAFHSEIPLGVLSLHSKTVFLVL